MQWQELLLNWYDKHGRDLPWRHTNDPYHILVSEIMLQQTQVDRVRSYYHRWMEQFPNFDHLARATNAEVIHAWAGLGYNRRALMLRDIARQVVQNGLPTTREEWIALKGIGPYTSAAVALFSQGESVLPIDTNTRRVLGRLLLELSYPDPKKDHELEKHFLDTLDHPRLSDVIQALFDLASQICTKNPMCDACPMQSICPLSSAFLDGTIEPPKRMIQKANERIHRNKKHPDRIFRGRILALLRDSEDPVPIVRIGPEIDTHFQSVHDDEWLLLMLQRLAKDHFIELSDTHAEISKK